MRSHGVYVDESCYFGPPSRALTDYYLERGRMPLHDAVGVNCESSATADIKEHVKVKSSMARSLPVGNLLPQNVGSIINYLQ